jgi:carbon storage regulator
MLVLSRKLNETIVINGDIPIMVVGIRGTQVRLGIEAPNSVGIFRRELCNRGGAGGERTALALAGAAWGHAAGCWIQPTQRARTPCDP